jgi:hypothetical protein
MVSPFLLVCYKYIMLSYLFFCLNITTLLLKKIKMTLPTDVVVLDSRMRDTPGNTDSNQVSLSLSENVHGTYELMSFHMANNLYNVVSDENNKVYWEYTTVGNITTTITPGYYSGTTLATFLQTQMRTDSGDVALTCSYSSTTGKLSWSGPPAQTIRFKFGTNTTASARKLLGMTAVDGVLALSQVSIFPIDLKLHTNIVVKIFEDNNKNVYLEMPEIEASFTIPVDPNITFGDILGDTRNNSYNQYISFASPTNLLTINLYSADGEFLQTNYADWIMIIRKLY